MATTRLRSGNQAINTPTRGSEVATIQPEAQAVTPPRLGTAQVDDGKGHLIYGRVVVMTIPEIDAQLRAAGGAVLPIGVLISA